MKRRSRLFRIPILSMSFLLVAFFSEYACLAETTSVNEAQTGSQPQTGVTPESVVRDDINAQNAGDWITYSNLRATASEEPESARLGRLSEISGNILSARLESLKPISFRSVRDLMGSLTYGASLKDPQAFYVVVDYEVRLENKYICDGPNARLYLLDYVDNEWRIIQVSEPPIAELIKDGFGFGTEDERTLLSRQQVRLQTGRFVNSKGRVVFSAERALGESPDATNVNPPSCIRVAITDDPEHGSTNIIDYKTVSLSDYIADVLPNEWSQGAQFDAYPESLKAGALAIKTYVWWRTLFPHGSNFDVYDSTADQVYKENTRSTNSAYTGALTATADVAMSQDDGTIFQAQYWNGIVDVANGGADIHSGACKACPVISSASGGDQLTVVNGGTDFVDGYNWWQVKKAGYPLPANGFGYVAGSLLMYQSGSGPVSIDTFQNGTFKGQLTQYGTKYWAYTGDSYQTVLTRFYNSSSPKTNHQNIRFFNITNSACGNSTLTINGVTPIATQTL